MTDPEAPPETLEAPSWKGGARYAAIATGAALGAALGYGVVGAARAVEHLRTIAVELQMAPTRTGAVRCAVLAKQPSAALRTKSR